MIINASYFLNKPLFIPNAVAQPTIGLNTPSNEEELNMFIEEKEAELLLSFLGHEQLTELQNQLNPDGTWIESPIQKWVDLVEGKDAWKGLRYEVQGNKISLIAYYVYFYFLGEDATSYTTTGIQRPVDANSQNVLPNNKQVNAWIKFIRMYGYFARDIRPEFFRNWNGLGMTWNGNQDSNDMTLYNFMSMNNDSYSTAHFTNFKPVNQYNL